MEDFLYFFTFQDPSITWVVLGITLLGIGSAYVGTFSFLDKKALLGDAISHAVLPGICLGFVLAGEKDPRYIVTGAFIWGLGHLFVFVAEAKYEIERGQHHRQHPFRFWDWHCSFDRNSKIR